MRKIKSTAYAFIFFFGFMTTANAACKPSVFIGEWNVYFGSSLTVKDVQIGLPDSFFLRCSRRFGRAFCEDMLLNPSVTLRVESINVTPSCEAIVKYTLNNTTYNLNGAISKYGDVFSGLLTDATGNTLGTYTAIKRR